MSKADEIEKIKKLLEEKSITEEEFQSLKSEILGRGEAPSGSSEDPVDQIKKTIDQISPTNWGVIIHLSQFSGFILPVVGFAAPVAIWLYKKDESNVIAEHGRNIVNWMISLFIYYCVAIALSMLLIGIPAIVALMGAAVIFPIIGALKASNSEVWKYPFTINFIKQE